MITIENVKQVSADDELLGYITDLTLKEVQKRIQPYFTEDEIEDIIKKCNSTKAWSDGIIVIIYNKHDNTYSIITNKGFDSILNTN